MKIRILTSAFYEILSIVKEGLGNSKILPITEYLNIKADKEKGLIITSTDLTNFITYYDNSDHIKIEEEGEVKIKGDQLVKLISKTNTDYVKMQLKESHLEIEGNGKYKLEIINEEFPSYDFGNIEGTSIDIRKLQEAININENTVAREMLIPSLTGFKISDKEMITTDSIKMCYNKQGFFDQEVLIPQKLAELVKLIPEEEKHILFKKEDNKLLFQGNKIVIFGTELNGIDEYPDITTLLNLEYGNNIYLDMSSLNNALERMEIFITEREDYALRMLFGSEKLILHDLNKNNYEEVKYGEQGENNINGDIEILVNINFLKDIIKPLDQKEIRFNIDTDKPIMAEEGSITMILSTMDEKDIGEEGEDNE